MMFDGEPLGEWLEFETFRILSDDYQQCPACEIGILIPVDSEPNAELLCDICDAIFKIQSE